MGICGSKQSINPEYIGSGHVPKKIQKSEYSPSSLQWIVGDGKLLMFNKDNLTIEEVVVRVFLV